MATNDPSRTWVDGFVRLYAEGETLLLSPHGLPFTPPEERPPVTTAATDAPTTLLFSPHPDDEIIVGGLPLRLRRELHVNVVNVAVTLGSRPERRAERWRELQDACRRVGFGLVAAAGCERGLEGINPTARAQDPRRWQAAVETITGILTAHRPAIVFAPHAGDWNQTHVGTHQLVFEALARCPQDFACQIVETEYWRAMETPNLMVESSAADVAELVAALARHVGEVARNAYHLRLPAWMMDNVRRGAELIGGQGAAAPRFVFATLYRLRHWADGRLHATSNRGGRLSSGDDLGAWFPSRRLISGG